MQTLGRWRLRPPFVADEHCCGNVLAGHADRIEDHGSIRIHGPSAVEDFARFGANACVARRMLPDSASVPSRESTTCLGIPRQAIDQTGAAFPSRRRRQEPPAAG
jgi:hypothetical protein